MEYLLVLAVLASSGFLFAGLKTLGGTRKTTITRLQL